MNKYIRKEFMAKLSLTNKVKSKAKPDQNKVFNKKTFQKSIKLIFSNKCFI